MLDLDVVPERAIGNEQWEFALGMSLNQAIHIIRSQDKSLSTAQLRYSQHLPLSCDIVINLLEDGIKFTFDPLTHRLKLIEVYNFTKLKLKYSGHHFSNPPTTPDYRSITRTFGATHPGVYESDRRLFTLHFRGVFFVFPIDGQTEEQYSHGLGKIKFAEPPPVQKMVIYSGNCAQDIRPPVLPLSCYHGNAYLEHLEVLREGGVTLGVRAHLLMEDTDARHPSDTKKRVLQRVVKFGDTVEDVTSSLGAPNRTFYKLEDKMLIHSPVEQRRRWRPHADYFYNYFTLGLDVLFDGGSHKVMKLVLHTNYPGHYNFNMYYRCFFEIPFTVLRERSATTLSGLDPSQSEVKKVKCHTKWPEVEEWARTLGPPAVLNRFPSTNTTNPFQSPLSHCVEDCIFEVIQNNHIASVTLFQTSKMVRELAS